MFELQLEVRADVGVGVDQGAEFLAVQSQRQHIRTRPHRRRPRLAVEQLGFAEAVAGAEDVQRDLVAAVAPFLTTRARPETMT